jgi:hypothetical protein
MGVILPLLIGVMVTAADIPLNWLLFVPEGLKYD